MWTRTRSASWAVRVLRPIAASAGSARVSGQTPRPAELEPIRPTFTLDGIRLTGQVLRPSSSEIQCGCAAAMKIGCSIVKTKCRQEPAPCGSSARGGLNPEHSERSVRCRRGRKPSQVGPVCRDRRCDTRWQCPLCAPWHARSCSATDRDQEPRPRPARASSAEAQPKPHLRPTTRFPPRSGSIARIAGHSGAPSRPYICRGNWL
ncbi:hypothetical protein ACVIW3_005445 [Bradyrhizobium diazoefficiens]